jgi:hypothetical protein
MASRIVAVVGGVSLVGALESGCPEPYGLFVGRDACFAGRAIMGSDVEIAEHGQGPS